MSDLSVVIVNWNTRELLAQCLQSVDDTAGDLEREVLVVDNASTDGSVEMVQARFPQVRLLRNAENVGFARANNQALPLSRGRCILLLNSDTRVHPGALAHLMRAMDAHPRVGAVGPRMLNADGSWQNSYGALPSVLSEIVGPYLFDFMTKPWGRIGSRLWEGKESDGYLPVERVSFACTLVRREALAQVGLLDQRFAFYSEDYDWFKRLQDAGWSALFCPAAKVTHYWGASSRQRSAWALSQLYRSKRLYYAKHYGTGAELALRVGLGMRFIVKLTALRLSSRQPETAAIQPRSVYRDLLREMLTALPSGDRTADGIL